MSVDGPASTPVGVAGRGAPANVPWRLCIGGFVRIRNFDSVLVRGRVLYFKATISAADVPENILRFLPERYSL